MRAFLVVVVLLLAGIVGLGFYQGWFQVSSDRDSTDQTVNTTFTVDPGKMREDKEKLQEYASPAQEESGDATDSSEPAEQATD
jgi:cytoskeletal protein RodZ